MVLAIVIHNIRVVSVATKKAGKERKQKNLANLKSKYFSFKSEVVITHSSSLKY